MMSTASCLVVARVRWKPMAFLSDAKIRAADSAAVLSMISA